MTPVHPPPKKKVSAIYLFYLFFGGAVHNKRASKPCALRVLGLLSQALCHEQERGKVS